MKYLFDECILFIMRINMIYERLHVFCLERENFYDEYILSFLWKNVGLWGGEFLHVIFTEIRRKFYCFQAVKLGKVETLIFQ